MANVSFTSPFSYFDAFNPQPRYTAGGSINPFYESSAGVRGQADYATLQQYQQFQQGEASAQKERAFKAQQTQDFWDRVTGMLEGSGFASGPNYGTPNFDDPGLKAIQGAIRYEGEQGQSQLESALARSGIAQGGALPATTAMREGETQALLGQTYFDYTQKGQDLAMREWEGRLNAMIAAIQAMAQGGGFA